MSAPPARQAAARGLSGLLAQVARGDQSAFAALYQRTAAQVLGPPALMLGDTATAEDITVAVYPQLWQSAGHYDSARGSAHAWLMSVAHRHAAAHLLVYYRGYTAVQAASLLGLPAGTAEPRLRAALCALSRNRWLQGDKRADQMPRAGRAAASRGSGGRPGCCCGWAS
jgi:DNA-directed RNA polymerase specialized sigma24 family protein